MNSLSDLIPSRVFYYFEELSKIPRGSGNTTAVSNYCADFARHHGLTCYQDNAENIIIIKPATKGYEGAPAVILQGHLDMVNEKEESCHHDFINDGLTLKIDGDWISADGTTLGGDDGIAVAYGLALLEAQDIPHPRLECIFTTDEEVGMTGAMALDTSMLRGKYMINLDSEEEGIFLTSCAGGIRYNLTLPVAREKVSGKKFRIELKGMTGGHSGCEIDKGRANADILMGRFLYELQSVLPYRLISLEGGLKDNAIPRNSRAEFIISPENEELLIKTTDRLVKTYQREQAVSDPKMDAILMPTAGGMEQEETQTADALDMISQEKLLFLLNFVPDGIQSMSMDIKGLVESSLNLGIMKLEQSELNLSFAVRSSIKSRKTLISSKLEHMITFLGGGYETFGDYPEWEYCRDSKLREIMIRIYREMFEKEPLVEAIHAGLECGLIAEKIPGIDIVSIGPDMQDIHTPKERLSISSTRRTWEFLLEILNRFKEI